MAKNLVLFNCHQLSSIVINWHRLSLISIFLGATEEALLNEIALTVVKIVGYVSRLAKGITNVIAVDSDR